MQIVYIFFVRLVYDFLIIFIHANCKVDFLSGFFFILKKIVFIWIEAKPALERSKIQILISLISYNSKLFELQILNHHKVSPFFRSIPQGCF